MRPLASSLQRRRRPAPTWTSTRPRGREVSTIWSTIDATPHPECGPHRAAPRAHYKVGVENRLRMKKLFHGVALLLAGVVSAAAADMPTPSPMYTKALPPPPPV